MLDLDTPAPEPRRDINDFRLPQNFGSTLGVQKVLTNIPVGKPGGQKFFRTHPSPSMEFPTLIYQDKTAGETYVVSPTLAPELGTLARPAVLHVAVDRVGNAFLIPVMLPDERGNRNPWHDSLAQAVKLAQEKWVRVQANRASGHYDVIVATAELSEPTWPTESVDTLVDIAFRGRTIKSPDHPIIQGLQGKI